ncbi:MAG: hypothetical protein IJT15_04335, partial [Rickettsiales bacterium]|nr:hypothetical protein [Rickettsiales bacterium]
MFGSDVNTVPDNVNMNATPIGWCGLHPFITGGVIGALAGGVGCLAGCMLRDKRNQATWKVLGNDIWKKYTVKRTDGKEITVQEIRKFYANPDIYGGWWNYLRDIPIYQVEERDKDNNNNDNSIEKNINIKDYVSNNDYKNNNDDNIKNNKIVFTIQKRDNMFIKGKEGQELIKRFLKEIPEGGIKIGDEIDLKKIYNMIISNQGRLKEFLDFLISHYEVNKDADILSFITSVLISLGDDELIKFLMGDENLKKVVLKIMDESEDEGVVALRETLREEAIKIVSVKEFFKDNDLGKQIQALSFLLTVPGLMDAANTNGELNDWFISLLKYYQNKPIPKDSIPLIIGLLSKMDINDILKTK